MTECGEALLLVERLKRRTRDHDVLALCQNVEGERRPRDVMLTPLTLPSPPTRLGRQHGRGSGRHGRLHVEMGRSAEER